MKINLPCGKVLRVARINGHYEFDLPNLGPEDREVDLKRFWIHLESKTGQLVAELKTKKLVAEEQLWSG